MENVNTIKTQENVPVMYVLVRDDMRYENEAVQAGHAVAEYLINHTPVHKDVLWSNGIMVYLAVKDEVELLSYAHTLYLKEHKHAIFEEPDWGESQFTALATIAFKGEMFTELRTLKMPKGYLTWLRKYIYKTKKFFTKFLPITPD